MLQRRRADVDALILRRYGHAISMMRIGRFRGADRHCIS